MEQKPKKTTKKLTDGIAMFFFDVIVLGVGTLVCIIPVMAIMTFILELYMKVKVDDIQESTFWIISFLISLVFLIHVRIDMKKDEKQAEDNNIDEQLNNIMK